MSRNLTDEPFASTLHHRWGLLSEPEKYRNLRLGIPYCEGIIEVGSVPWATCRPFLRADFKEFYYFNTSNPLKAVMVTDSGKCILDLATITL